MSLDGVSFGYDGSARLVLRDVSLEIEEGKVTAVLGPNGSGKTTLLRLLLGVLRPTAGTVSLGGRPLSGYSRRQLSRSIAVVPQDEHIPFDFSVLEYVLLGRAPYVGPLAAPGEADIEVALQALRTVGLEGMAHRVLPTLSGGERQLAVVARALAQRTRVLLLDEPTAHLDLSNQGRLLAIIRHLAAGGTSLVFTTHDPNLASLVGGNAVLMRRGEVLDAGPVDQVLTADNLSATYGVNVAVHAIDGRRVILLSDD